MRFFKILTGAALGAALWIASLTPSGAQDFYMWRRMYPYGYQQYVQYYQPYLEHYYRVHLSQGLPRVRYDVYTTAWFNLYMQTLLSQPRTVEQQRAWFNNWRANHAAQWRPFEMRAEEFRRYLRQ
jgi:hypothetical protein